MRDPARGDGDELSARVGELRRLTIMFCDVVGSTELSGRQEPESYRDLMRGYRDACKDVIESQFEGHIVRLQGDGTLSIFGFPVAHENDAERGVRAGLALVRAVREISSATPSAASESLDVRVAVHHGPVYVDFDEDDIYGLAANVGARLHSIADPGTVVISDDVRHLVAHRFEIEDCEPHVVRGLDEPLMSYCVVGERAVPQRLWSAPMVERESELGELEHAWAHVAGGGERQTGVLVFGDAGVGKSRLVAALADRVRATAGQVIELHGSPFHADAGLHPVRTLIETRIGSAGDADPAERLSQLTEELARLGLDPAGTIPLLAPILGIHPSAGYEEAPTAARKLEAQVLEAAIRYIQACMQDRPGLLLAEDLHWFDDATRELLTELIRAESGRMLVVVTSRNREPGNWDTIELQPLTLEGRLALIDALGRDVTEEDRVALAARSDGIPLYLEELMRTRGTEAPSPGGGHVAPVPGSVPEALYEPLVARLYATPSAIPVAATAAAAGQEVDRSLLEATMSMPAEELDSTLSDLVSAQILEPIVGRTARYRFRHELLREVAYELQPPSWRRKVHSMLGDFLGQGEPGDWHVLASHFERAERHEEASYAYQQTAESARRRGALHEARAHLTHALDLVRDVTDEEKRDHREVTLRLRRGFLAMTAEGAQSEDASADFDRCLELVSGKRGSDDLFSTLISVWVYDLSRGELTRARRVSETLRVALGSRRHYFRPQNNASFGMLDWFCGSFTSAAEILTAATNELAEVGREDEVAKAWFVPNDASASMHVHHALARFMVGDVAGSDESLGRARARIAQLEFPQGPWSAAYADWVGSWMMIEAGRLEQAERAIAELRALSARHGFDNWDLVAATQTAALEGIAEVQSGSPDAATLQEHAEAIGSFIEFWQALGLIVFLPFYLTTIGVVLVAAGDADGARERYDESLRLAADTKMCFYDAETMRRLAHLEPDRDARVAGLHAALDLAKAQAARPFELRIALDLHDATGDSALPLLGQAVGAFRDGTSTSDLDAARTRVMASS